LERQKRLAAEAWPDFGWALVLLKLVALRASIADAARQNRKKVKPGKKMRKLPEAEVQSRFAVKAADCPRGEAFKVFAAPSRSLEPLASA